MLTYDYDLIYNAYYGTNGFSNGGYLIKHKRETDEDYATRQENAYYLNYFAPITNSLVTPIFKKPATRDWTGAKNFMELFVQDIDGNKTTISEFMKRAALKAKLYGSCFIVVDNFSTYQEDETVADVLKSRKIPYAFCLTPQQIISYEADKIGIITSIDFQDIKQINSDAGKYYAMHFDRTSWKRYDDKNIYETGTHNLGRVPVTVLTCKQLEDMTLTPPPELLSLAKVAKAIYNTSSWLMEIFRSVTFPLLTIPSLDAKNIVIGNNNALGYEPEYSHEPNFIAPPSDPANVLKEHILDLVQEMYRMAGLSFVTGTKTDTSGVSKQWDFERLNQQLADFAQNIQRAEADLINIFSLWINQPIEYNVSYPNDFNISDIAYELENAQAILDLNLSDELREDVLKKILTVCFPDMDALRFDEIVASLKEEQENKMQSNPLIGGNFAGDE